MKVITNTKLIKRNAKIGQILSIAALSILGVGLYISFKMPDKFVYSLGALLLGFFMSQIGMYYGNRWGRSPRPDELIDKGLKGLGRDYSIYHFVTPAAHLLVSPAGIWVIITYYLAGTIRYEKKRWRVKGGGFTQSYLRAFGQENIGRPDIDSGNEIESATRHLRRTLPEGTEIPEVRAILLFVNPKAEINVNDAPVAAMKPQDLKEFFKAQVKEKSLPENMIETIRKALPQPDREE
jgi:hypothetical protein